jgi:hypothetical protein
MKRAITKILDYENIPWMKYGDVSGSSGVENYSSGNDFIWIEFKGNVVYLYHDKVTGEKYVRELNQKAILGKGLSTFISQNASVNSNYLERYRLVDGKYQQF